MFRLLSDLEVALNELLVACRESVDHFRDGAQLTPEEAIAAELKKIANMREPFLQTLERKIRELGDLPTMPDPDKEDSEMLIHHLGAAVSSDYTNKLLQQRIEAEQKILEIIDQAYKSDEDSACQNVLNDLRTHVHDVIGKLTALVLPE